MVPAGEVIVGMHRAQRVGPGEAVSSSPLGGPRPSARCAVVIPTYNRAHMIGDALVSLLAQTEPCEVYVYDDGSTDNTREVVARFPGVQYLWAPHKGMTPAFNAAVAWAIGASRCPYIAWLGSDDTYTSDAVKARADLLASSGADVVFSGLTFCSEGGWRRRTGKAHAIDITAYGPAFATFQGNVHTGTAMFRREVWQVCQWHEGIATGGADLLWVYECWCRGLRFAYVPRSLYHVRRHPGRQIMQRRAMDQALVLKELEEVYWPLVRQIGGALCGK